MSERITDSRLTKQLDEHEILYMKIHGSAMGGNSGSPDYHLVIDGIFYGFEAKGWSGKVFPNQYDFAERILNAGGRYFIVYPDVNVNDILDGKVKQVEYEGDHEMTTYKGTHELILPK